MTIDNQKVNALYSFEKLYKLKGLDIFENTLAPDSEELKTYNLIFYYLKRLEIRVWRIFCSFHPF